MDTARPRVVIIGAGFGGLQCARKLRDEPVDVVLVDRQQLPPVHAAAVPSRELPAEPGRRSRRRCGRCSAARRNVRFRDGRRRATSTSTAQVVHLADGAELAVRLRRSRGRELARTTSATTTSRAHALGLKDLGEALQLRNHVLDCLERATATTDADERRRLLTFCIVGGGPTGVEYAGALAELVRLVLPQEYPELRRRVGAHRAARRRRPPAHHVPAAAVGLRAARSSSGAASTSGRTRSSRRPTSDEVVRTTTGARSRPRR